MAPSTAWSDDEPDGRYPGLPFVPCSHDTFGPGTTNPNLVCEALGPSGTNDYAWLNFPQVGLAGAIKAKQWTRIPISIMASTIEVESRPSPSARNEYWYKAQAFFVSPDGSSDNYGLSAPITVRTVAFGSVPAEVTLQVDQKRDTKGLPKPLTAYLHDAIKGVAGDVETHTVSPALFDADVDVRVLDLKLDGVSAGIRGTCGTGPVSRLHLTTREYSVTYDLATTPSGILAEFDPEVYQYGLFGGTFEGSIDIGSFRGCTTSTGDDVSPILTSAVSGPDNPISVRIGAAGACTYYDDQGRSQPVPPGDVTPAKACPVSDLGYENKKIVVIPKIFEIPTFAPGQAPD